MSSIIEQINDQQALIKAIFNYLKSENTRHYDRQLLIDKCAHFNWLVYRDSGYTLAQVNELTCHILDLIENEDYNWFIDHKQSTGDTISIIHPQKQETIELHKTCLLLPFMLGA